MNTLQQALMMGEWTCPNPWDIHTVEIPDELEAYEFWDTWKHTIEVIWPDEPDISHPPMEEERDSRRCIESCRVEEHTLWRIYFFNQQMEIVEYLDRLTSLQPHRWAETHVRKNGYYTYAIGAMR